MSTIFSETCGSLSEALQKGIMDYNVWASQRGKGYSVVKAHNELRGILYNKLMPYLKPLISGEKVSSWHYCRILGPDDLNCKFVEGAYLIGLKFTKMDARVESPKGRDKVLLELAREQEDLTFEVYGRDVPFELTQFVNNIKNFKVK